MLRRSRERASWPVLEERPVTLRPPRRKLILGAILVLSMMAVLPGAPQAADSSASRDSRATQAELEALRHKIQGLRGGLSTARGRHSELAAELQTAEQAIGRLSSRLRELDRELKAQRRELRALRREEKKLTKMLDRQRGALARQVRASYAMGRQEYLKLLLNQQDAATLGRTLAYYDYLNRARVARIETITRHVQRMERVRREIGREQKRREALRGEVADQKTRLEQTRRQRQAVLQRLDAEIRTKEQRLTAYLEDARQLGQLLRGLREALADIPARPGDRQPFGALRGRLPLPSEGKLLARYGTPRKAGNLRWNGVLIGASEGTEVRAVSHGRVAFAEWLRGFGLMVILDHGDGYMTLYGYNQSLYVETGDWVEPGEVLATVGRSGGRRSPGLYFEIRHHGKPTNPLRWCRR